MLSNEDKALGSEEGLSSGLRYEQGSRTEALLCVIRFNFDARLD
jgi:hypothetical protein